MSSNTIDDHEGMCPCCKTNHCEQDNEHNNRVFWESSTGESVCRACIQKEDEEEEEKEQKCDVCHKSCLPEEDSDLVLITEIKGVKHCDECFRDFLVKKDNEMQKRVA